MMEKNAPTISDDKLIKYAQISELQIGSVLTEQSTHDIFARFFETILSKHGCNKWLVFIQSPDSEQSESFVSPGFPALANKGTLSSSEINRLLSGQKGKHADELPGTETLMEFSQRLDFGNDSLKGVCLLWDSTLSKEVQRQVLPQINLLGQITARFSPLNKLQDFYNDLNQLRKRLSKLSLDGEPEMLYRQLIQLAQDSLQSPHACISLLDEDTNDLIHRKTLDLAGNVQSETFSLDAHSLVARSIRTGKALRYTLVNQDNPSLALLDIPTVEDMLSAMIMPLSLNHKTMGAIQVFKPSGDDYNEFHAELLSLIAVIAAQSLQAQLLVNEISLVNAQLEANRWELIHSRDTLRSLFDNLPTAMYIVDDTFQLLAVNNARAQRVNEKPQTLVGNPCYRALFHRTHPCSDCRIQETFREAKYTIRKTTRLESDGETSDWEIYTYPVTNEDNRTIQAIILEEDITEKLRLERTLAQSEKLAVVGQLAAGVAHEINNPLTAIIANAQLLQQDLPEDKDLQESVDLILRAGSRAAQVIRNLLDFARKEDYQPKPTNINITIKKAIELLQHELIAKDVVLEFHPEPNLPLVPASHDHLQSVWLNLVLNAIDALDKTPKKIVISTHSLEKAIQVIVADNGKGIPQKDIKRIFEPFFTTKAPGAGTGLGLSVSHRIIQQHGGDIRVESEEGLGSKFIISLPKKPR